MHYSTEIKEGYLWVAFVLGVGIWTEINVLTSNLSRLGSQLLGETTQVTLYTKGHLPPVSANRELLKALIANRLASMKHFGNQMKRRHILIHNRWVKQTATIRYLSIFWPMHKMHLIRNLSQYFFRDYCKEDVFSYTYNYCKTTTYQQIYWIHLNVPFSLCKQLQNAMEASELH